MQLCVALDGDIARSLSSASAPSAAKQVSCQHHNRGTMRLSSRETVHDQVDVRNKDDVLAVGFFMVNQPYCPL